MKVRLLVGLLLLTVHGWTDDMWWSGEGGSGITSGSGGMNSSDNLTLTCAAESIQSAVVSPYSESFSIAMRVIQSALYAVVITFGISLNTFVIVLVTKFKKLHTVSLMVSLQIVVMDLMLSLVLVAGLISAISNQWLFGQHFCIMNGVFLATTTVARTILLFAFVIDRFLSVFWPYFYPKHEVKIAITLSAVSWLLSVIDGIIQIPPLLDCYSFDTSGWTCGHAGGSCNHPCFVYNIVFSLAIVAPAIILPVILYTVLYRKARKLRHATNNMTSVDKVAQKEYLKREWKAIVTYGLLFATVFAITVPSIVGRAIIGIVFSPDPPPPALHILSVLLLHLVSFVNVSDPLVIMRNADVREVISKIKQDIFHK